MRPIDADALREIVEDGLRNNPHKDGYARVCHRTEYTHFLDVIQRMPTIVSPPNDPLTLEELREMCGEPVWCEDYQLWGIVGVESKGQWANQPFLCGVCHIDGVATNFEYDIEKRGLTLYRRKPEEGTS